MQYGMIMAGGSGTRLWPLSRQAKPKQLLELVKGKSLLQLAYERLRGVIPADRIFVCAAAAHRDAIIQNLPELPPENILGEPVGRDTANAVGFGAAVLAHRDPDAVMAVVTADHVIEPAGAFQNAIKLAFSAIAAHPQSLVTFGIVPTFGHTGLGYVERGEPMALPGQPAGAFRVLAFKEKPDKPTADRYVESGRYYWNSGMFVWRAETVLQDLQKHLPDSHRGLMEIAAAWGSPAQSDVVNRVYPTLPRISIDYAVMEPASQSKLRDKVVTVEMPVEWLDVGSWPALDDILETDEKDNATSPGMHLLVDSENNIVVSDDPNHLIATIGVSDCIIVHTRDVTMMCARSDAQRVKDIVAKVKATFGDRFQ